ncbi:MAG: allantoinase AllB [Phycisphaerales bacterium]
MKNNAFAIASDRAVLESGIRPATIVVREGVIDEVVLQRVAPPGLPVIDLGSAALLPGVIDAHVHVNEPGRTEWEGFSTAGRAAVAGGVTTMVVMPLNCSPVATTVGALQGEAAAAAGRCACDFGFWGGVVPGNRNELEPLWRAGVLGFKCFTVHSGIDEFPNVTPGDLSVAMPELARLGAKLLVHAEDPGSLEAARLASGLDAQPRHYMAYLRSRPPESESRAVETLLKLCESTGCPVHFVHLSARESLALVASAKGRLPISAETCPHYLALVAEEIADGATAFKCAPPIRERMHREALWEALRSGVLDLVASDHSPAPPELKSLQEGNFAKAWGGIAGLQVQLPAVWAGAHARGFSLMDIARWMSAAPARLGGIESQKGALKPGLDADLVVFDPEAPWTVRGGELEHRHKATPYDGRPVRGRVQGTFLRGNLVFSCLDALTRQAGGALSNDGFSVEAYGRWVKRSRASTTSPT